MAKTNKEKYRRCASCSYSDAEYCPVVPHREIREDCIPCTAYDGEIEEYQYKPIDDEALQGDRLK